MVNPNLFEKKQKQKKTISIDAAMQGPTSALTTVDYVVAVSILLVPVGIGVMYAVKDANRATRAEYLLGGRQMSVLPVAMSMFVTFQSAISLIGFPSEIFYYGLTVVYIAVGQSLAYGVGYLTIVPLMYPLQITSIYEYLQLRYKSTVLRVFSTLVGMLTTICYMSIALLSPALALGASAGLPLWMSIAVIGAVGTLYTAIGGIKSVIWTDAFQTVIIFIGMLAIIIKGCVEVGGVTEVLEISRNGWRVELDKFSVDPRSRHTVWSLCLGISIMWSVNTFNQSTLQRLCCMKTMKDAKVAFLLNIPLVLFYTFMLGCVGLAVYAYFAFYTCEPFQAGFITNRNQLAPYFVLHAMGDIPGMAGLFTSILCCGSLSTLSSGINALATNTVEDLLYQPLRSLKEATITFITKLIVLTYGAAIIGLTYLATSLDGTVTQMAMSAFGALGAPILGIFMLGGAVPWVNKYGALCGAASSLVFNLWVSIGSRMQGTPITLLSSPGVNGCSKWAGFYNISDSVTPAVKNFVNITELTNINVGASDTTTAALNAQTSVPSSGTFFLYNVSYEWYSLMGVVVCVVIGLVVSDVTNRCSQSASHTEPNTKRPDVTTARYIFPCLRRVWGMDDPQVPCFSLTNAEINVK